MQSLLFDTKELNRLASSINGEIYRLSKSMPSDLDIVASNSEQQSKLLSELNDSLMTIAMSVKRMEDRINSIESSMGLIRVLEVGRGGPVP